MKNKEQRLSIRKSDIVTPPEAAKFIGSKVLKSTPKVSIVIPAYEVSEFISEALQSVLAQSFKDYEIILVNDGSPDTEKFETAIRPYMERLVYLKIENIGVGPARNVALGHARGEIISFLDGDDVWQPEFLSSQVGFLEENGYDMVYSDGLIFGGSFLDGRSYSQDAPSVGEVTFESLLDLKCNVLLSSSVARKKAIMDVGGFEWKRVRAQDFNLWLRMAQSGARMGYQKKLLVKYRMRKTSLSGDSVMRIDREINSYKRIKESFTLDDSHINIIEKHLNRLEAEKKIQMGKYYLVNGNYSAAREAFSRGNEHHKSLKLKAIILALQIAPGIFAKVFKSRRKAEIDYIPGAGTPLK